MRSLRSLTARPIIYRAHTDESDAVLRFLARKHLVLVQDKLLPNVVGLVTGETVRSSWWSLPKGRVIFAVLEALGQHPDVLFTKLLHAKSHSYIASDGRCF